MVELPGMHFLQYVNLFDARQMPGNPITDVCFYPTLVACSLVQSPAGDVQKPPGAYVLLILVERNTQAQIFPDGRKKPPLFGWLRLV
jgi:hypothetical protein